jgi:hypothetical protein
MGIRVKLTDLSMIRCVREVPGIISYLKISANFKAGKNILEMESKNRLPVIQAHNWTYRTNGLLPDLESLLIQVDRIKAKVFI